MVEALAHQEQPGALHWIQKLREVLHLVFRRLGGRDSKVHQRIGQLSDAVLIRGYAGPELSIQRISQRPFFVPEIPSAGAKGLRAGAQLRRLIVGESELLLNPGGESLLDLLAERVGHRPMSGVGPLSNGSMQWCDEQQQQSKAMESHQPSQ
jgi:hypothetical protein